MLLLLNSFYRCGNWGPKRPGQVLRATQLVGDRNRNFCCTKWG